MGAASGWTGADRVDVGAAGGSVSTAGPCEKRSGVRILRSRRQQLLNVYASVIRSLAAASKDCTTRTTRARPTTAELRNSRGWIRAFVLTSRRCPESGGVKHGGRTRGTARNTTRLGADREPDSHNRMLRRESAAWCVDQFAERRTPRQDRRFRSHAVDSANRAAVTSATMPMTGLRVQSPAVGPIREEPRGRRGRIRGTTAGGASSGLAEPLSPYRASANEVGTSRRNPARTERCPVTQRSSGFAFGAERQVPQRSDDRLAGWMGVPAPRRADGVRRGRTGVV